MNRFVLGMSITGGVGLIVFVGIATNKLGELIIGLIVVVGMFAIGVKLFAIFTSAANERDKERHRHAEEQARRGIIPVGRGFPQYMPLPALPRVEAVPEPAQLPDPKRGVHFTDSSLETNVVNLLLFSIQALGRESKRIASNPECAQANIPGYNGRKWNAMINDYLKPNYEVAAVPGPIQNGGGAFVPEKIGTVGALYDMIVYKTGLDALPTTYK